MPDGIQPRCSAVVSRQQAVLLLHRTRGGRDDWVLPGGTGLEPAFVPVDELQQLDLRPPLTGHLRAMLARRGQLYAPYLANLWRPEGQGETT
jgi:hypothetical protein